MIRSRAFLVFLTGFVMSTTHGQQGSQRILQWGGSRAQVVVPIKGGGEGATSKTLGRSAPTAFDLAFDGASFDEERGMLPYFSEQVPVAQGTREVSVELQGAVYQPLSDLERNAWPSLAKATSAPEVLSHVTIVRKQPIAVVTILPFRKDPVTGALEKLVSFRVNVVPTRVEAQRGGTVYPNNSKLANGEWYRMSVARDGVYRVTHEFLSSMASGLGTISSDRINVYGNHFGLLPFVNSVERPTDLIQNAIVMEDGGDGEFGPGDHFLFYATGAHTWELQEGLFRHTRNVYTDSASYFIGIDVDPPLRAQAAEVTTEAPTRTVTSFNDRQFINRELVNLLKSGRMWLGETFDVTTTYSYNFETPFLTSGATATLTVDVVGKTLQSANTSTFTITSTGGLAATLPVPGIPISNVGRVANNVRNEYTFQPVGSSVPVTMTFNKFDPITSIGWLNYLELNCRRDLRMSGDQLAFRDVPSVGAGEIAEFVLSQAQSVQGIWEVSDPTAIRVVPFTEDGTNKVFRARTDELREFIAFRNTNFPVPVSNGRVQNQDLHATTLPADLVIICPNEFRAQAARLAERRSNEGMNVVLVPPQAVYNEFSSGARDATAIKRYMRMLYDKAGMDPSLMPRHLLLFGDGSFNNLSLAATNQNFIPSYQTAESIDPRKSYASDDYFGLLDATEGEYTGDGVDIGIGRLPISDATQAQQVVDKLLNYDILRLLATTGNNCSSTTDAGLADWRTHVMFASDDQEGDGFEGTIHMEQSDQLAQTIETNYPDLNVDKVYLDAYQQVSTPGGERYPQANLELKENVDGGVLLVNYTGHGGEVGWAHERFLDNGTINSWENSERLPLFMTATCEFTRWDDPGRTSAGELVLLNPSGGGIGLMTTSRLAFSGQNFNLARRFYDHVFRTSDDLGRPWQLGDIFRETKKSIASADPNSANHRNFVLMGDPSLRLALPQGKIRIASVTDTLGTPLDTMKALATVRITGFIEDGSGQVMSSFNGTVIPTVYDKESEQFTLANDGGTPFDFMIRKNIIYRGRATVTNGQFSFTFVVPQDINYQVGNGRISCYAESMAMNAYGADNSRLIGSTATNVAEDAQGPGIELFMNDELFVTGGMTNDTPLLYSKLFDENGINTVGSSIGHDLLAVLDENTEQAIVLNDLYQADQDTYKRGQVRYRFPTLSEGAHTLRLKAWDTHNNSSEKTIEFVVSASAELALDRVLNYPNPFTTHTSFFFEHNRPCNTLDVQVQVFTVSGRLVKTLNRQLACEGFRSEPLDWDGRDDVGDRIGRGVYVYRLSVATPDGERAEKFEKLVVLR
jgi:hypothetical protein